jgi:hypothetical protein
MATPKVLLAFEALLFAVAALVHAGIAFRGFEHARAATAEGVIAAILALGLIGCLAMSKRVRVVALVAQGFALLGTLVGAFTIAIGIGPQTKTDLMFHVLLLLLLPFGLLVTSKDKCSKHSGAAE